MPVPTSGNFDMFGTSNTTIQGAIVEGGASGASSSTDFNNLKGLASINKFDPVYAGNVATLFEVVESNQFRNYPKTSTAITIGTNLGSGFSSSSVACSSTGSIATVYVSDGGVQGLYEIFQNGKRLWTNSSLTTPYNGNNLWFKTSSLANNGDSFQIGTDGFISSWGGTCAIINTPGLSCSNNQEYNGENNYPTDIAVSLGSSTGTVTLTYDPDGAPDRFIVYWNNNVVIDTGYRSNNVLTYDFGRPGRSSFTSSLTGKTDPILGVTYPNTTNFPDDGYPRVTQTASASFTKNLASPTSALVKVYGPMNSTIWNFTLSCPA